MLIQNKKTKKNYPISKEDWETFGHKKAFIVIDASDNTQQMIENIIQAKPSTGQAEVKEQKTITIKKDKPQKTK